MKTTWIVVALAGALGIGCKGAAKRAPETTASAAHGARPLPGTESVQRLLAGMKPNAAPSKQAAGALGGLFGSSGILAGGGLASAPRRAPSGTSAMKAKAPFGINDHLPARTADDPGADPDDDAAKGAPDPSAAPVAADPTADEPAGDPAGDPDPAPLAVALPPPQAAGGDCAAVAARVGAIARAMAEAQLADLDAEARRSAEAMLAETMRQLPATVEAACGAQAWPADLRDCVLTATDLPALEGCERFATADMRAAAGDPGAASLAQPATPPPVWSGTDPDCAAAGEHAAALVGWQLSAAPPDLQQQATGLVGEVRAGVESACAATPWSAATIQCVVAATSLDALDACATGP